MKLLKRKILLDYQRNHADSRVPLNNWMNLIRLAKWHTPQEIKNAINSVDFLSGNRVIFNIGGNKHRLVVVVIYTAETVIVNWSALMRNTAKSSFDGGWKMNITVINTEKEYQSACAKLDAFLASHADELDHLPSEADKEFRLLSLVIGEYEDRHYPIPPADPIEFIKFMMEQKGLKVKDIASCFGTASRAYEVLNRKRSLTLAMIRKLRAMLGCPADSLIEA